MTSTIMRSSLTLTIIIILTFDPSRGQNTENPQNSTTENAEAGAFNSTTTLPVDTTTPEVSRENTTEASNPCAASPCQNGASCVSNSSLALGYRCQCLEEWFGENCTQKDFCFSSPCLNGGSCNLTSTGMFCMCTEDYTGETCETAINRCIPNPCEQNASCTNIPGDFNCSCPPGYGGKRCELDTDLCDPDPCMNGASCIQNATGFSCLCTPAFTGLTCEQEINFCVSYPCQNNGTCVKQTGGYNCTCLIGFTGKNCEINIDDCVGITCAHGGTCQDGLNSYSCLCAAGWTGNSCQNDINECEAPPDGDPVCDVNAQCDNTEGGYNCTCKPGYSGDGHQCNFMNACASSPCLHGNCYSKLSSFVCFCSPGWQGTLCDADVNECDMSGDIKPDCDQEYGLCENTVGSYTCTCKNGTYGDGRHCTADILYPYHNVIVDSKDDVITEEYIPGGLAFFGQIYTNIYISTNGYITLGMPYERQNPWRSGDINPDVKMIAPYWTDLDLSSDSGSLYYDEYYIGQPELTTKDMFARVKMDSAKYAARNASFSGFEPSYVGVITWHQVAPFPGFLYKKQNVTFQCVLATDSRRSFTIFIYDRDHMFINASSNNWTIAALLSKGTDDVLVVAMNVYRPDKETNQGVNETGRFVFKLGDAVVNNNLPCLQWYNQQDDELIKLNKSLADACPCTGIQAGLDQRYVTDTEQTACYRMKYTGNVWNLCCYDDQGALLPSVGGTRLVFRTDTREDYDRCCTSASLCHLFYEKRPPDTCQGYKPPVWGAGWGEPHFSTFDGKLYTFNGLGEFVLLSLADRSFMLQGRTDLVSRQDDIAVNATVFFAFASQQAGMSKLELRLDPINKDDINIRIDGVKQTTLRGLSEPEDFGGIYLKKLGGLEMSILHKNGIAYKVGIVTGALWITVSIPPAFKGQGQTVGLLGTFDGSPDNDLMYRDGQTVLSPTANEEQIFDFGKNWTVQQTEALFNYSFDGGKVFEDYFFPKFLPMWFTEKLENLSTVTWINENLADVTCGTNVFCLIDYIATGSINQANWTKQKQEQNIQFGISISNSPPVFAMNLPTTLDVMIGQKVTLTLTADDPEQQTVSVKVITNLEPSVYNLENNVFEWTPSNNLLQDGATVYLRFYAVDSLGAAALYWPTINFCGCDKGDCVSIRENIEYIYSSNQFYSALCHCRPDSKGRYCTEANNPCQPNPCYSNVSCMTDPESDIGFKCAECPQGTIRVGDIKCYDVNECLFANNTCQQVCTNLEAGYLCSCHQGYTLSSDLSSCEDIDECTDINGLCTNVGEYCMNTPGSYKCVCKSRFYREQDKCIEAPRRYSGQIAFNMIKINNVYTTYEPEMSDVNTEQFNTVARLVEDTIRKPFVMHFKNSFKRLQVYQIRNGSIVAVFDLFFDDTAHVNGTYLNEILQDYLALSHCVKDGPDCTIDPLVGINLSLSGAEDKDLCLDRRDNDCDTVSTECFSADGKFYCRCRNGFQKWLDYTNICQDVDECKEGSHDCDGERSTCENNQGSYECVCHYGYRKENDTCVDSCQPNPCHHGGLCVPVENTNICKCQGSWVGPTCTEENSEAIRMRNIAIAVSVTIGAICLILLIILIICCVRQQKKKYTYSCRPVESKYHGNSATDHWTESQTAPGRAQRKTEYEMKENGSGDSLMQENMHRTSQSSSSDTGFDAGPRTCGVENRAYSSIGETKQRQSNVSGEYF